jgi:glycosyltransferase involved in cell wall biosynthesis
MKINIVIPTKNELDNLKIIVPSLKKKYNYPIIIIDKSNDGSQNNLKKFCHKNKIKLYFQKTKGKGNALKESIKFCKGDLIVFFDADCSHDPDDIEKLVKPFKLNKSVHHVGGSRMRGGSDELYADFQHFIRLFGSLVINLTINLKFGVKLTDTLNGLRAIKKNIFKKLNPESHDFAIEVELVSKTLSAGYNYVEIPTHEWQRKFGVSKIGLLTHSWQFISMLISILFLPKPRKNLNLLNIKINKKWYEK